MPCLPWWCSYHIDEGPLTVADGVGGSGGSEGCKRLTLQKRSDNTRVEVEVFEADITVREVLADGSSVMLSHNDNILTEVSRSVGGWVWVRYVALCGR